MNSILYTFASNQHQMEQLFQKSQLLIANVQMDYIRPLAAEIDWSWRLNAITGARGTGKTTLLLQQAKRTNAATGEVLYVTLDDIFFTENRFVPFAQQFYQQGGRYLYVDEVHKYPEWAREIKNIYDFLPDLHITFTGSSAIEILRQEVDLSRRAIQYKLHGLSYREYLLLKEKVILPKWSLEEILQNHVAIATDISQNIRPLKHFQAYLKRGYYPYFLENEALYLQRLERTIRLVLETDLNFIKGYDPRNARKIFQLLYILASNVPFKPNISKLSEKIGIHRNTLIDYLHYLQRAQLINTLYPAGISTSILQKPEKIFLNNTNLAYAIASENVNAGSERETFFFNQLQYQHEIELPKKGDFFVNDKYTFEIGGSNKKKTQIVGISDAFIVSDAIEIGLNNRIPLWLFGLLY